MDLERRKKKTKKVNIITLAVNLMLSIVKLTAGVFAHSAAMISDGLNSLSDVVSTFVVMVGLHYSQKELDDDHPYGHEKIECVAAIVLTILLMITALTIAYNGVMSVIKSVDTEITKPGVLAIYAAVLSIITKEFMYRYTVKTAKEVESTAMLAAAWDHRSDVFLSLGSIVGIVGARLGLRFLDPLVAVVIAFIIGKLAIDIGKIAIAQLVDQAADNETVSSIKECVYSIDGVICIDELKTRTHANRYYVDIEATLDRNLSFGEAHSIAESIHAAIEDAFPKVKHCTVHVSPTEIRDIDEE